MMATVTACWRPVVGTESGIHVVSGRTAHPRIRDWRTPIPSPARAVRAKDSSRPSRAAARAGTTSSGVVVGLMPEMGSMRITATPASTEARAQQTEPSRSGEIPTSRAPFSLPAAARVASPKRVKRNRAARATVTTRTRAASSSRFWVTVVPSRRTGSPGSTGRRAATPAPATGNRRRTISWR